MSDPFDLRHLPDPLPVAPLVGTPDARVHLPGSKSLTNRALVAAGLAEGTSVVRHALDADDTEAMVEGLVALGVDVRADWSTSEVRVTGCAGRPPADVAVVDARLSGTTARFLMPVAALCPGTVRFDGAPGLRARPMGEALGALRALGARVEEVGEPGHLPVDVRGPALGRGPVHLGGDVSSQFLSGLLLSGPALGDGLTVVVEGALVSAPYVAMTEAVMTAFGATVDHDGHGGWTVAPGGYRARDYEVEPDASTASYFFAAAAICGGTVTVEGLGSASVQGDLGFVDVLEAMGAVVVRERDRTTVHGGRALRGIEVDLADRSDVAQTLAAVAVHAEGPTRVRGIGFIRAKETDRIGALVSELRRAGVDASEEPDGFVVRPGPVRPTVFDPHGDHRMAMSLALLGLRQPGVAVADPACVAKTFPGYWAELSALEGGEVASVPPTGR